MSSGEQKIGIYEKALPDNLDWSERLCKIKQAGYDYMEISIDESDERISRLDWNKKQKVELLNAMEESGIPAFSMCLSGHRKYSLGSSDKSTEKKAIDIALKAIDFAVDMGVRIVQLAGYDVFYEPSTSETAERFCENLKGVVRSAGNAGVMVALEPVDLEFINNIEKAVFYMRQINSPWLQIYPDIANIAAAGYDPSEQLMLARGHIVAVHFKDSYPGVIRNVNYGDGIVNFPKAVSALRECEFSGPILIEMWDDKSGNYMEKIEFARHFAVEAIKGCSEKNFKIDRCR